MKITYDKLADAQYIYVKKGEFDHTQEESDWLITDRNSQGEVLGIEILEASKNLPQFFLHSFNLTPETSNLIKD